ncbi:MAG: hypothetical protein ACU0DH_05750 [Paracoccus sp. (in: a-proteobacteria)]|uniref:hypothetical protein n=2 Tax=Paracoccus sp. TaxID=267 RepID=UPI0040585627
MDALPVHRMTFVAKVPPHLASVEERHLQEFRVNQPHEVEVLPGLVPKGVSQTMTAVSTEARIAGRPTGQGGRVRSGHASRPAPGLGPLLEKSWPPPLSDPRMQIPNLIRGACAQRHQPPRPARRVSIWLIIVRGTPNRLASLDTVASPFNASSAPFAVISGACCLPFDIDDLSRGEDQHTADQS